MNGEFDTASTPLFPGVTLLEASAGTGKTYAIEGLVLRLVAEYGVPLGGILACTFTNAATRELASRIRSRLLSALAPGAEDPVFRAAAGRVGEGLAHSRLVAASASFDSARIHTIHGFCSRVISEHAFESGALFGSRLAGDGAVLARASAADYCRRAALSAPITLLALRLAGGEPENLLAKGLLARGPERDMPLAPPGESFDAARSEAALDAALSEIRALWPSSREALFAFFLSKDANKPLRDAVPLVDRGMDSLARGGVLERSAVEAILALTPARIAAGTSKRAKAGAPDLPLFAACGAFRNRLDSAMAGLLRDYLDRAGSLVDEYRERASTLGFDDLIRLTARALREGGNLRAALRRRLSVALVDEFQDTDSLQWEIFRSLFAGDSSHSLFLIGDPKQAIYRFRGADVRAYLAAAAEAPRRHHLAVNWRSDEALVAAVNAVFSATAAPFGEGIAFSPVRACGRKNPEKDFAPGSGDCSPLHFALKPEDAGNTSEWMRGRLAQDVCALLSSGARVGPRPIGGGDIAVLVRSHRQAAAVCETLAGAGIPAVEESDESVFDSAEAGQLRDFLSAAREPSSPGLMRRVLADGLFLLDAEAIADGAESVAESVREFAADWEKSGFTAAFRKLERESGLRKRFLSRDGGERALTNLLHLAELLGAAEREERLGPGALSRWLSERIADKSLRGQDGHQLRLESDDSAVRVLTCHKSKGLEFPVVFAPFFPTKADGGREDFLVSRKGGASVLWYAAGGNLPEEVLREEEEESMSEETRLLYVLLTRARSRCTVYLAPESLSRGSLGGALSSVCGAEDAPGLFAALRALASAHPGAIGVSDAPLSGEKARYRRTEALPVLSFEPFPGTIDFRPLVTSFSALHGTAEAEAPEKEDARPAAAEEAELSGIAAFPSGASAGSFFHACLEKMNFADSSRWREEIAGRMKEAGFDEGKWLDLVAGNLSDVLNTPLSPGGPRLADLAPGELRREAEFFFPAHGADPGRMAQAFVAEGGALAACAPELRRLSPGRADGYLKGYIDLVFRSGNRLHVLDWKSNRLGASPADYTPGRMDAAMRQYAYYLQGALYALALRRQMAFRAPDWDYGRDFGEIYYVFLRGVERDVAGSGVVRFRPSAGLLDGLEAALGTKGGAL